MFSSTEPHNQKLLLLLVESSHQSLERRINDACLPAWRSYIEIRSFPEQKSVRKTDHADDFEEDTNEIVADCQAGKFYRVIAQKFVALDTARLRQAVNLTNIIKSSDGILDEVVKEMTSQNMHWRAHARTQWAKSDIKHLSPEKWCEQFTRLGVSASVGQNLLKMLRVVSDDELRESFKVPEAECLGQNVVHAYFADNEHGSSSLSIKSVLEHMYPEGHVVGIDFSQKWLPLIQSATVVYMYEDGLWSGVELVKRLLNLVNTPELAEIPAQLNFRYGITCDAGIMAGRLHNRKKKLTNINVISSPGSNHYSFLKVSELRTLVESVLEDDDVVRKAIDAAVEPFAFAQIAIWGALSLRDSALHVCETIGAQLVPTFLQRREMEKQGTVGSNQLPVISEEKAKKWALGAMKFASTIVFAKSIPKPVLPLMWLDGQVNYQGKSIQWEPLFWDVRRTGRTQAFNEGRSTISIKAN